MFKPPTLDFNSSHDLRVMRSGPSLGSKPLWNLLKIFSLSFSLCLMQIRGPCVLALLKKIFFCKVFLKGAKKRVVDPLSKKEWYENKAPAMFHIRIFRKHLVLRTLSKGPKLPLMASRVVLLKTDLLVYKMLNSRFKNSK